MASLALAGLATPTWSIPQLPLDSCANIYDNDAVTFDFVNEDANWTTTERSVVRSAVDDWEVARDFDDSQIVAIVETSSPEIHFVWDDSPGGTQSNDAFGYANCGGNRLELNPDQVKGDNALLSTVAAHEMGHALGLQHTGGEDSHNSDDPSLMATCLGVEAAMEARDLTQDDVGSLVHIRGNVSPETIHANASFERNFLYWAKSAGSVLIASGGSANGNQHIRYKPTQTPDRIYQTMNFVPDAGDSIVVDGAIKFAEYEPGGGNVRLEIMVGEVDYDTGGDSDCFPSGVDQNDVLDRDYPNAMWIEETQSWAATSGWSFHDLPSYAVPGTWDGADLRVRVRSSVTDTSGNLTYVNIDHARIRDQS